MKTHLETEVSRARSSGAETTRRCRGGRHRDETGTALVELAIALPLVALLLGVAFNGWNGMQASIRLTSAARAGAIAAASDLSTTPDHAATTQPVALQDATTAINAEEGVSGVYQSDNSAANDYVSMSVQPSQNISGQSVNLVTITISQSGVSLVPFVGSLPVTTHATARYTS